VKGIFDSLSVPEGGHYLIYHTEGVPHAARPTSIPCSQIRPSLPSRPADHRTRRMLVILPYSSSPFPASPRQRLRGAALTRYRTRGEHRVVVHQVNVSDGGQAIVGSVSPQPAKIGRSVENAG
jgi:hypothetical protein